MPRQNDTVFHNCIHGGDNHQHLTTDVRLRLPWLHSGLQHVQECKLALFMPKTTDTVVTEIAVENLVRPLVMAAAVVPRDEAQRAGWVQGGEPAQQPGVAGSSSTALLHTAFSA